MELIHAQRAAEEVLAPACRTVAIAGGIRRSKADSKDIELAALVADLVSTRQLEFDPQLKRNGPKYKWLRVLINSQWLPLDLFIVEPDAFGSQLAIRIGDATFFHQLVTQRSEGGLMPPGYFHHGGFLKHLDRGIVPVPTGAAYFAELGLPLVPPAERCADTALRLRQELGVMA